MYTLPSPSHVDLWIFSIDPLDYKLSTFLSTLSQDELEKATKFHFAADRAKYIISHGLMRQLLAYYLGCEPHEIDYQWNKYGKPSLSDRHTPIHFNLTHSQELAALAIASNPIGVDIEKIKPLDDYVSMTKHFMSATETGWFRNLAPQEEQLAFYRAWTRKEAYIKAIGMGLSYPVEQVTISLHEQAKILEDQANPANVQKWDLISFELQNYAGAIAIPKNEYVELNILTKSKDTSEITQIIQI